MPVEVRVLSPAPKLYNPIGFLTEGTWASSKRSTI